MALRGIRGAVVITEDNRKMVLGGTRQLLEAILSANSELRPSEIGSVFFSVTDDIVSAFPAEAARDMGWLQVPLICFREIPVAGSLPLCIRILVHWNTDLTQEEIHHVYLGRAKILRRDYEENEPASD
jgi:chorismate mutase